MPDRESLRADTKIDANLLLVLIQNARATRLSATDPGGMRDLLDHYEAQANKALDREARRCASRFALDAGAR